jgi:hypothetical protein
VEAESAQTYSGMSSSFDLPACFAVVDLNAELHRRRPKAGRGLSVSGACFWALKKKKEQGTQCLGRYVRFLRRPFSQPDAKSNVSFVCSLGRERLTLAVSKSADEVSGRIRANT